MEPLIPQYSTLQTPQSDAVVDTPPGLIPDKYQWACAPIVFGLLTFLMFFDLLFTTHRVISHINTDLRLQFIPWREFGFNELAHGNLALWNPHIYGGAPYFAGFQSALLYPPNWLHLFLPVGLAINWIVAVHVFILGYFVYFWVRGRGIGISGAIVAGVMFMFCGPYFLHLYAGHLPHLAVIVWTPLMLLALDKISQTGEWKWLLLGIGATSMHILGGHPQYVYYTGMVLVIYAGLGMIESSHRLKLAFGFVAIYLGAVLVTAVQLFAGIDAASEGVRSTGLSYELAGTFSLAPLNLITLLVPTFFGNLPTTATGAGELPYWGAGYLWEMSLFASVTGLILAVLGAIRGRRHTVLILGILIFITFILALGRHISPLYWLMYHALPGYNGFRGTVKFAYLMMLFISLLGGMGFDALLRDRRVPFYVVASVVVAAVLLLVLGTIISASGTTGPTGAWGSFIASVAQSALQGQELFTDMSKLLSDLQFLASAAQHASHFSYLAAGTLLLVALLLAASRYDQYIPYGLMLLIIIEMSTFARSTRATLDPALATQLPPGWSQAIATAPKDQRVLTDLTFANQGMSKGFDNLNGYDPGILRSYAELIFASQGLPRSQASQYLPWRITPATVRVLQMLRCSLLLLAPPATQPAVRVENTMPLASVYGTWARFVSEDDLLAFLLSERYQPSEIVCMLAQPDITMTPVAGAPGSVRVVDQGTDWLEVETDLQQNAMLLITNNYSSGWRVVPITSQQKSFSVLRANYCQIGVPLLAGKHHLVIEYSPLAYRIGWVITIISLLSFGTWGLLLMRRRAWFR